MAAEIPADAQLLVCTLDPVARAHDFTDGLGPHVTVMPWFKLPVEYNRSLANMLENYTHQVAPFVIKGGEMDSFEPEAGRSDAQPIPVRRLAAASRLPELHRVIRDYIRDRKGEVYSPWVGAKYIPHVSYLGKLGLAEGEPAELTAMQQISRNEHGIMKVDKIYSFRGKR